jgi:hypothetical protein
MQKINIFILPDYFISLYNKGLLPSFFNRLNSVFHFCFVQKDYRNVTLFIKYEDLQDFSEMDIYEAKIFLSFILDAEFLFSDVRIYDDSSRYCYYQIGKFEGNHFEQIQCETFIDAFETEKFKTSIVKIISGKKYPVSLLKINISDRLELPYFDSIQTIDFCNIEVEIFFDIFIKLEFNKDIDSYKKFKIKYFDFYQSYNWEEWNPLAEPVPAHEVLMDLRELHKPYKDDSYLLKWANIMSFLNGARFNKSLTILNEKNKNVNSVFQSGYKKGKKTIFFSSDLESGVLEIYDYQGKHINKIYGIKSGVQNQDRTYVIQAPERLWI